MSRSCPDSAGPPRRRAGGAAHFAAWVRAIALPLAWLPSRQLFVVAGAVLAHASGLPLPRDRADPAELIAAWPGLFVVNLVDLAGALALVAAYWRWVERRPWEQFGLHPARGWAIETGAGLVVGSVLVVTLVALGAAAGWYRFAPGELRPLPGLAAGLLVLMPLAAAEELLLRGGSYGTLAAAGPIPAAIASAALFATLHLLNPSSTAAGWLGTFLAGVYLAAAFGLTGRLYYAIGIHTAWNLVMGIGFGLPVSGFPLPAVVRTLPRGPVFATGGAYGPEAGLLGTIVLLLHIPTLVLVARGLSRLGPDR